MYMNNNTRKKFLVNHVNSVVGLAAENELLRYMVKVLKGEVEKARYCNRDNKIGNNKIRNNKIPNNNIGNGVVGEGEEGEYLGEGGLVLVFYEKGLI